MKVPNPMVPVKALGWWIFDNVPLGHLAPWWFGMLIGRMPQKCRSKP